VSSKERKGIRMKLLSVIEVIEKALKDNGIKRKNIGIISNSIVNYLEAMQYEIIIKEIK